MFIKQFKVKSNNQLKGTERKKLFEEIIVAYPTLTEEELQILLPKPVNVMKVVLHNGQTGKILCVSKVPIFFQINTSTELLFPTIYTLWKHPNLLPTFTTCCTVEPRLADGADLMLPGICLPKPITYNSYGKHPKGTPVYVNTSENKAAIAVGVTALSGEDMYMAAGRGKCVEIYHVIGDSLCQMTKSMLKPDLGPIMLESINPEEASQVEANKESSYNDVLALSDQLQKSVEISTLTDIKIDTKDENYESQNVDTTENDVSMVITDNISDPIHEMDELLRYTFLSACKSIKPANLPILSSNFFKNYMMAVCPPEKNIDVKKSKYKKLSVFLAAMKEEGIVNTNVMKGVESIVSIKMDHPSIREAAVPKQLKLNEPPPSENSVIITECYKVTADVLPILSKFGYEKGDVMKRADIRKYFTEYVKTEQLQDGKILKLNPHLANIYKSKADEVSISMEDGINKFIGRMTRMHEVTSSGNTLLHTGKLEPVDMRVTVRTNNKKVTLVNNLETFGINLKEFSKECQSIGASATIIDDPGKKTPSVLIQGNQILHIYKLLTEKYGIKKNYIKGLEFAPKKNKK